LAEPKSTQDVAKELQELVVDYGKQETVEPLKNLGQYLGAGIAGSVFIGTGIAFLLLAVLRLLQWIGTTENEAGQVTGGTFNGDLSYLPYFIVGVLAVLILGGFYWAIQGPSDSTQKETLTP
jgi:hypothetical protein